MKKKKIKRIDMDVPTLPQTPVAEGHAAQVQRGRVSTKFDEPELGLEWNYIGAPRTENYSLTERPGWLRLKASPVSINSNDSPTWVGRRQQHIRFQAKTRVDASGLKDGDEAGLTLFMSNDYHCDLAVRKCDGKYFLVLKYKLGRLKHTEKEFELNSPVVNVRIVSTNKDSYSFEWGGRPDGYVPLGEIDTGFLSSETAGGFTGVYLALYTQSDPNGGAAGGHADFDDFLYMNHEVPERP